MNTPDATKPQATVMSPNDGKEVKPHYVVNLFGNNEQTGGEAKTTVRRPVPPPSCSPSCCTCWAPRTISPNDGFTTR